jgi:hypothetical protein
MSVFLILCRILFTKGGELAFSSLRLKTKKLIVQAPSCDSGIVYRRMGSRPEPNRAYVPAVRSAGDKTVKWGEGAGW